MHALQLDLDLIAADARELEHVRDQARQAFTLVVNVGVVAGLLVFACPALAQHLRIHADAGQWRAQFVADRGDEVALLTRERDLAHAEPVHQRGAGAQHDREHHTQPGDHPGARSGRQARHREHEIHVRERHTQARAVEQCSVEFACAGQMRRRRSGAVRGEDPVAPRDAEVAHLRHRAAAEGAFDEFLDEARAFEQRALDDALTVAPHLPEHHEVAAVEQRGLERIDLALEGADRRRSGVARRARVRRHEHLLDA